MLNGPHWQSEPAKRPCVHLFLYESFRSGWRAHLSLQLLPFRPGMSFAMMLQLLVPCLFMSLQSSSSSCDACDVSDIRLPACRQLSCALENTVPIVYPSRSRNDAVPR